MATKVLYNVTVSVDHDVAADWLEWMKSVHIPDVMATGMFIDFRVLKVLSGENSGMTYAIQYVCESHEKLNEYQTVHAPALQRDHMSRYGERAVAFRTVLEILE